MIYPAHIRCDDEGRKVQTVTEHCRSTARYASEAQSVGLGQAALLAGLLHDAGKFTAAFREYLTRAAAGEPVHRGSVNHSSAGVRMALERWYTPDQPYRNLTCELIAFAVGAHHGLFDCIGPDGQDGFARRTTAAQIPYEEARDRFLAQCAGWEELDALFGAAEKELGQAVERCRTFASGEAEGMFSLSLLERLLLSYLIDADRRDTAEFMLDYAPPQFPAEMRPVWQQHLSAMEGRLMDMPYKTAIHRARRAISDACRTAAERGPGIYRLSVPTGGGKTLAALRYALAAGAKRNCPRIFFVVPLLSVLEQNAAVIREYLNDDGLILEHHSNVVRPESDPEKLDINELLVQTWQSPVVITTLVQLLNTLFSGQTTCIRRMRALVSSVIVIDEVQSLPRRMLSQFNLAMNFLAGFCGATVVLCSATQPCLEKVSYGLRYSDPAELVPYTPALWQTFRRTEIIDRRRAQGYTAAELASFARDIMQKEDSLLMICNTKAEARALYQALRDGKTRVFHLSTSMCMAHRIQTLREISLCLAQKQRILCVSTQLVEAGVDFSFACVIRVCAGMDNVVQAAGRCNRNGEFERLCPVYIVNIRGEDLSRLREIRESQLAAESLLVSFARDGTAFHDDLASNESIRYYYRRLFSEMPRGAQDYSLPPFQTTLVDLLSCNRAFGLHCPTYGAHMLNQAFLTAGSQFYVFESDTVDAVVPYGEGEALIAQLCSQAPQYDLSLRRQLLEKARLFTVSLYDYEVRRLAAGGGLSSLCGGAVLALQPGFYQEDTGFDPGGGAGKFMEV